MEIASSLVTFISYLFIYGYSATENSSLDCAYCGMINWEGCEQKRPWPLFKVVSLHSLKGVRKATKASVKTVYDPGGVEAEHFPITRQKLSSLTQLALQYRFVRVFP